MRLACSARRFLDFSCTCFPGTPETPWEQIEGLPCVRCGKRFLGLLIIGGESFVVPLARRRPAPPGAASSSAVAGQGQLLKLGLVRRTAGTKDAPHTRGSAG